jgi:hypothetical protein
VQQLQHTFLSCSYFLPVARAPWESFNQLKQLGHIFHLFNDSMSVMPYFFSFEFDRQYSGYKLWFELNKQ